MKLFQLIIFSFTVCICFAQESRYDDILNEFKKKNYQKAISLCKEKIVKDSTDVKAYAYLSYAYFISSERRKVETDMDTLRKRGIKKGQTYLFKENENIRDFLYLKIEYDKDTLELSRKAMIKAISLKNDNLEYQTSLCQIYLAQGDHKGLLNLIGSISNQFPMNPAANALNKIGLIYFNKRNYQEAIDVYKVIISKYDRFFPSYSDMGATYLLLGKIDSAVQYLKIANKISPADSLTNQNLYQAYLFQQKFPEAVHYKEKTFEKDTSNPNLALDLGFLYFNFDPKSSVSMFDNFLKITKNDDRNKNLRQAIKEINDDQKRGQTDYYSCLLKSETFYGSGFLNYAICILVKLTNEIKNYSPALFNLAIIYRDLNMYKKAVEYFEKCETLTSELEKTREVVSMIYIEKVKTYFLQEDYSNVIKYTKLCIEKFKQDNSLLHYLLGLTYLHINKKELAYPEFKEAVRINDNPRIVEQAQLEIDPKNYKE